MTHPTLFDQPAPHNGTVTSRMAAAKQTPDKQQTGRAQVLQALADVGEYGATRKELEAITGLSGDTVRPRVSKAIKDGLIVEQMEADRRPLLRTIEGHGPSTVLVLAKYDNGFARI